MRQRPTVRTLIVEALQYGPQTMPGLLAALERPLPTVNNVLFAMVREGIVRRAPAYTNHGRDRVYWLPRRAQAR